MGSTVLVDRVRASGQDDAGGLPVEIFQLLSARKHLRVNIELSQAARDEMCVLRTASEIQLAHVLDQILTLPEVENQNRVEDLVRLNIDRRDRHGGNDE